MGEGFAMNACHRLFLILLCALAVSLAGLVSAGRCVPPDPPDSKVANMERLNTEADEDDPCAAPDGIRFFFTSNAAGNLDIMVAERPKPDQRFGSPKVLEELAEKTDEAGACPAAEGEYLYFARQLEDPDKQIPKNFDVFFTRRLNPKQPYSRIAVAAVHQVCTTDDERHPWLTLDGKELYFSRRTKEGWRVGVARRPKLGTAFDPPEMLDLPVGFYHASVTRDGLTMYLQGPADKDDKDRQALYVSRRPRGGKWGPPEALDLGEHLGKLGDRSPSVSPDGRWMYFASDRPGGKGGLDIYVIATSDLKKK